MAIHAISSTVQNSEVGNIPSVPPFPSTKAGHKSLGLKLSKKALGLPVLLTVMTVPKEEAVLPRKPRTKFWAVCTTLG